MTYNNHTPEIPVPEEPTQSEAASTRDGHAVAPGLERDRERPDPTRYGDWGKSGRCIHF